MTGRVERKAEGEPSSSRSLRFRVYAAVRALQGRPVAFGLHLRGPVQILNKDRNVYIVSCAVLTGDDGAYVITDLTDEERWFSTWRPASQQDVRDAR